MDLIHNYNECWWSHGMWQFGKFIGVPLVHCLQFTRCVRSLCTVITLIYLLNCSAQEWTWILNKWNNHISLTFPSKHHAKATQNSSQPHAGWFPLWQKGWLALVDVSCVFFFYVANSAWFKLVTGAVLLKGYRLVINRFGNKHCLWMV